MLERTVMSHEFYTLRFLLTAKIRKFLFSLIRKFLFPLMRNVAEIKAKRGSVQCELRGGREVYFAFPDVRLSEAIFWGEVVCAIPMVPEGTRWLCPFCGSQFHSIKFS